MAEIPTCLSVIVCDDIYRDEDTKKLAILGAFNTIQAQRFPARHERMNVLFTLTNGKGEYDLSLAIEHAESGEPIIEMKGPLVLESPLGISDFNVVMQGVIFPSAGKYWVCVKVNGQVIAQRPFLVNLASGSEQ